MTRQTWTTLVSAVLFLGLAVIIAVTPVPFVAWAPGETIDVMGESQGTPVLNVSGIPTYPSTGTLRATTVSATSVDSRLNLYAAVAAYLAADRAVIPREAVYPVGLDAGTVQEAQAAEMDTSQLTATAAALRAAGQQVTEVPMVTQVTESGPANGKLHVGDLITAVDGNPVSTVEGLRAAIRSHAVGDTVTFAVVHEGVSMNVEVKTSESNTSPPVSFVGIVTEIGYLVTPKVTFAIDPAIGGPSAGLVFALAVYDKVTPGDLLAGRNVAGTGTISGTGEVGAVGGVLQKIAAAKAAGATIFVLPRANCGDVGGAPEGIRLVSVSRLSEAVTALTSLTDPSKAASVPGCS